MELKSLILSVAIILLASILFLPTSSVRIMWVFIIIAIILFLIYFKAKS